MFLCPKKHVLLFSCLIPASNSHVLLSNYHAQFSCANLNPQLFFFAISNKFYTFVH